MNTLFEIANLNAIYIDAADRDDVADKIYLKNQDKVCGVVGFYDNGDIKLITDDSDIKIEFEILKRLAGFDLGCEDIYDLSEKLNNAIAELRATFEKVKAYLQFVVDEYKKLRKKTQSFYCLHDCFAKFGDSRLFRRC